MKLNIKEVRKDGRFLSILTKKPLFMYEETYLEYLNKFFGDDEAYLYSRVDGKYVKSSFKLDRKRDADVRARIYFTEESDYLKLYKYVILVDKEHPYPTLVNDGRVETGVRSIYFESEPGCVPILKIEK